MGALSISLNRPAAAASDAGSTRRRRRVSGAAVAAVGLAGVWLLAHEGHDAPVRPIYKQVQV